MKKCYKLLSVAMLTLAGVSANAQCNYSIQMDDSWGDGWNGNQVNVTIAGTTTTHELLSGLTQTDMLSVNTGDSIYVDYLGGGSFNSEVSFTLLDASGNIVYASPAGPTVGINYAGVTTCPANDIGVSMIDVSVIGSCASNAETITIDITNAGSNPQSNFNVNYILNGTAATAETVAGPLAAGATMSYTFTSTVDLSAAGTYNIDAFTMLSGDQGQANDTSYYSFVNSGVVVSTFPYTENFDANAAGTTVSFANGWVSDTPVAFEWTTEVAGTPSSGTGPVGPAGNTGAYIYTEATGSAPGDAAELYSPCLDLTIAASATLDFTYYMFGTDMGTLYIEASSNGAWVMLDSIVGQAQAADSLAWLTKSIDLTSVSGGTTTVRFTGIRGAGFTSDIAIDDVTVTLTSYVGINEFNNTSFTVYPNPSNGTFTIASNNVNENVSIRVYDIQGRVVYSSQKEVNAGGTTTVSLGDVEKGVYLVNIQSATGRITKTIIVE